MIAEFSIRRPPSQINYCNLRIVDIEMRPEFGRYAPCFIRCMVHDYLVSGLVIGCAIEVHKCLGPGLKEQSYAAALCEAFNSKNIRYERERTVPVVFQGVPVGRYRPDLIVENTVVVEVKSVDRLAPVFTSQLIRYLKISQLRVGLLLNFNCPKMAQGIKRVVR